MIRGYSSIGRISALHALGCRFKSDYLQMKNLIEKDKKIRKTFKVYEIKKKILNFICNNLYFDIRTRKLAYLELYNLPSNSSITRSRRRCVLTGRSRAVYRNFKLCRNMFRSLALKGYLPGVSKASW